MLENGAAGLRIAHSTADSNIATNHSISVVLWLPPLMLLQLLFLAGAQLTVSSRLSKEDWPFVCWNQRRSAIWKTSSSGVEDKGMVFDEGVRLCRVIIPPSGTQGVDGVKFYSSSFSVCLRRREVVQL